MKTLNSVMEDIKSLRGADVTIFGQPTKLANEVNRFTIDVLDVLDALTDYEVDVDDIDVSNYSRADNTYNWCAPISNDINFEIYNEEDACYIRVRVHRYGDIRSNYTDGIWFCFDNEYDFFDIIVDYTTKYDCINIDGVDYSIETNVFVEGHEVYDDNGYYVCTAYGYDAEDIVDSIKENIK